MKNSTLGAHGHSVDGESLQADVMRFMAIIAFCLIAILALVRNVEPAPAATEQAPAAEKVPAANNEPAARLAFAPPPPQKPETVPQPLPAKPEPMAEKIVMVQALAPPLVEAPQSTGASGSSSETQPETQPEVQQDKGLSLRFASDRDFMRLVTKGEIQVYAFHAGDEVFGLARNFEFNQAPAPGRVYELLPDTIPQLVMSALQRATDNANAYTWGIRLPAGLEGRIRRFVDRAAVGELVIDRFGEVHHVAG